MSFFPFFFFLLSFSQSSALHMPRPREGGEVGAGEDRNELNSFQGHGCLKQNADELNVGVVQRVFLKSNWRTFV